MPTELTRLDIDKAYRGVLQRAQFDIQFVFLSIVATVLCVMGFIMDSEAVVIGAMVISPLMNMVIGLSATVLRKDMKSFFRIFLFLIGGILITIIISAVISLFWPKEIIESSLIRTLQNKPLAYFIVAFFSGMTAVFCYYWPRAGGIITGIAIAIALVPPVSIFGCGLAVNREMLPVASMIVVLNIIGIFIGSVLVLFILHRFLKKR